MLDQKLSDLAQNLKMSLGDKVSRVEISSRTTPVANFIEASLTLKSDARDYTHLAERVEQSIRGADFSFSDEAILTEANKIKTSFLKNIEKPHMFGIYNAHEMAVDGFEAVLTSYESDRFYQAAKELAGFKIQSDPVIIIQQPEHKSEQKEKSAGLVAKLFEGKNGAATLIVKQNPASNLVAIHYLFKHKAPLQSKYGKDAAKILHDCFGQRMKSEENKKISNRFGLSFTVNDNPYIPMDDIYLHPDFGYIRAEGLNDDIEGLIRYLNEQMLNFIPSEQEFKNAKVKLSGSNPMMMGRGDPAKKKFEKLYKKEVYEDPPYPEGPEELTYTKLLQFAREYFQPANMVISVVSSAAPEKIHSWFANFKGQLVTGEPAPYTQTIKLHDKPVTIEEEGGGNRSYIFWGFAKQIDSADKPALKALSLILRDKIVFDIREKQGMAYRISAGIELKGDRALFYVKQGTRPQNVDKLIPQYSRFFKLNILDGLNNDDLQKSLSMYLGRMMFRRLSSINQAFYLGTSYYFHNDINYDLEFLDALKKVTLTDVRLAAQKYLHVENPVQVIVR